MGKKLMVIGVIGIIIAIVLHISGILMGWQAPGICFGIIVALVLRAWIIYK